MAEPHFPSRTVIESYGGGCFRFAGVQHRGSLLILPSGMRGWRPMSLDEVSRDDLKAVLAERAAIGLLLFGTGATMALIPDELRDLLSAANIGLEIMGTGAAVRTYNVLLAENRPMAAALLAVP